MICVQMAVHLNIVNNQGKNKNINDNLKMYQAVHDVKNWGWDGWREILDAPRLVGLENWCLN